MKKKLLIGIGVVTLLTLMSLAWLIFAPAGPIVVGRDSTYLTEPIDANGMVDYEQAIVDLQGEGVTPEENAAIPLLTAIWPAGLEPEQQQLVCEAIGMPLPESAGMGALFDEEVQQLVANELNTIGQSHPDYVDLDADDTKVTTILLKTTQVPWLRGQLPALAKWIEAQQPHLAELRAIQERPKFFLPSPDLLDDEREGLLAADNPVLSNLRDPADVLKVRAMLAIGERRPADAWEAIKTLFALSRCRNQPDNTRVTLYSYSTRAQAYVALTTLLASGDCNAQLLDEMESFLAKLKPLHELPASICVVDRLTTLDSAVHMLHDVDGKAPTIDGYGLIEGAPFDQNVMLIRLNAWYDQLAAALEVEGPFACREAVRRFNDQLEAEVEISNSAGELGSALFSRQVRGELVAKLLGGLMIPAAGQAVWIEQEKNAQLQLLRVAVAIQRYQVEHGNYPADLAALADKINPALLIDPHTGKPMQYQRRPPGFLLYAIGPDGTDDGGNSSEGKIVHGDWALDNPNESSIQGDLVIRLPLPEQSITDFFPWNLPPEEEFDWEDQDSDVANE
ncbi:hypothetical protein [Blastopirellula retiformator]|uniref:Bacterial type II secretion system protein G n=1 Tax=Blastopirellula retiformator TaxID=2527970 RepID=A0A5C5VLF5_9BACT|nr:hypothetical protein [Blastopirellula retiformator]TWT38562.1 hypothetical protein Enr8_02550 [Blastopirellula retiformator]